MQRYLPFASARYTAVQFHFMQHSLNELVLDRTSWLNGAFTSLLNLSRIKIRPLLPIHA